tara:strand:+ start:1617 stop:2906 length:1290 start_codon:yes stop_codon:yes gene_type:complete
MIPAEIIEKKRDGKHLNSNEINWFVDNIVKNKIDRSQLSALLMAIYFQGMNDDEMFSLVDAMVNSGKKFNFRGIKNYVADKHSTGGVGDKISFILAPILSSLGVVVPMIAGRGLAFTGGTIDKLESIPNFHTSLSMDAFNKQIKRVGCTIASQSEKICPADKIIYATRDLTGTVPSLPLICSSIMSKKIAEDLDGLVIDLKVGNGTFMKTLEEAKILGAGLKKIGQAFNINTDIVYTNMNQPLGKYAGLRCEILESIDCLTGNGPSDLMEITLKLGSKILIQSKIAENDQMASNLILESIENKNALNKFKNIISSQGGDVDALINEGLIKNNTMLIRSKQNGFIKSIKTNEIGWALVEIGAGRKKENDKLDYFAGIEFINKIGDEVKKGDAIFRIFGSDIGALNNAKKMLQKTYSLAKTKTPKDKMIIN